MNKITLIATTTFGLEKVVKNELQDLGFAPRVVMDGRIEFEATLEDIPRANLWLRSADRVLIKIDEFVADNFDDLFDCTTSFAWEQFITREGKITVKGKSVKSVLSSVRVCQSMVKKAILERLQKAYTTDVFPETGADFTVRVALFKDRALLTLDTSGAGLHKRGYRQEAGEAPLKETLAAALVQLSFWRPDRSLIDPLCGSGTILIEAALIARNIAPGLDRAFAAESWPLMGADIWAKARDDARNACKDPGPLQLCGYDIDADSIAYAKKNAHNAGVADAIIFKQKDINDLWIDKQYGIVISNPPYGVRMSSPKEVHALYITLHNMFRKKAGWSIYILTGDAEFPNYFKRARPDRVRKLYNGTLEVNFYQYYGQRPVESQKDTRTQSHT